eukprot:TRINITY_DN2435_c0_g1_i1.p1 TRINITY_DN2435_c0_g1~~TRINITY_DN2435_c0_g1_i1.p1  ORF type:complete len:521 (-),score=83.59 TRINITY_DN2435_c0_g1_i1:1-1563(-)
MALTEYLPVAQKQQPAREKQGSSDSPYWKSFITKNVSRHIAAVNYVNFCPAPPHDFAVTSSTRVVIYDGESGELKKTFSKFKDMAYSGVFRSDGQIIAAGGESGIVQVFDVNTKMILRQLKGHGRPVRMVRYAPGDKLHLLSGGDDCMVKWWDVTTQEEVENLSGHRDYVRCGAASPSNSNLWATGSYDHTVRLWDLSSSKTLFELKHGKPVEDVIFFPSGSLLASAGGNVVKIWDILSGGRAIHVMESHQKTVMSLCISKILKSREGIADAPMRLITASLDGFMKAYDVNDFKITHSAKYPAPIRSMGISSSCMTMAIGTQSGDLFIRQRKKHEEGRESGLVSEAGEYARRITPSIPGPNHYRYFLRGQSEKASNDDLLVEAKQRKRLPIYDKALKSFCHTEALVCALETQNPKIVIAVMEELIVRKNLMNAVRNLNLEEFELLIKFLCKHAVDPSYSRFLLSITERILDRHAKDLGKSESIKHQLRSLKHKLISEVQIQQSMQELQGIIQPLIFGSTL